MGEKPTKEEILQAVQESGYLAEQEIATILEKNQFNVQTNKSFEDLDTKKSREIDVFATKNIYFNEKNKIRIFVVLLCECKNNSNPFVFIGRNKNERDEFHIPEEFSFPIMEYRKIIEQTNTTKKFKIVPAFRHFKLQKKTLFHKSKLKYIQFSNIVRKGSGWTANHEGIFDPILIPMIKSLMYYRKKNKTRVGEWKTIWLHFPVVVLNSDLLKIDSTRTNYSLESEPYLSFIREMDADNMKGTYIIDFTNKKHFQDYLRKQVDNVANQVKNIIETKPDYFLNEEIS